MLSNLEDAIKASKKKGYEIAVNYESPEKKVLIIVADDQMVKYIHAFDRASKEYIISIPSELNFWYHNNLVGVLEQSIGEEVNVKGGGEVIKSPQGKMVFYGKSSMYGEADHKKVMKSVEDALAQKQAYKNLKEKSKGAKK